MAKKVVKKGSTHGNANKHQFSMRAVTSDVCEKCRKCARGIKYIEKMSQPGAIGNGVPCILTKGKG